MIVQIRLLPLLLMLVVGCRQENKLNGKDDAIGRVDEAVLKVTPDEVDFGDLRAEEYVEQTVTVKNIGTDMSELLVSAVTLSIGEGLGFEIVDAPLPADLKSGESIEIVVGFSPVSAALEQGQIVVEGADISGIESAPLPDAPVWLSGDGTLPLLAITPEEHDYGELPTTCEDMKVFTLTNVGDDLLEVTSIAVEGDGTFDIIERPLFPLEIAPGASAELLAGFAPTMSGEVAGEIVVESNDPNGAVRAVQFGTGVVPGVYTDSVAIPLRGAIDLVVLVDRSVSMADEQETLIANAALFAEGLSLASDDWQVMVVNSDDGCNVGGIMTPSTPNFADAFTNALRSGSEGTYSEALTYVATLATDGVNTGLRGCNEGFVRPEALLHLVFITDEADESAVLRLPAWDVNLQTLRDRKRSAYLVKGSVIGGDRNTGCNSATNHAGPAKGYLEFMDETYGGFLSICAADWGSEVDTVASYGVHRWRFPLTYVPQLTTLAVTVNGTRATNWYYDEEGRDVVFFGEDPTFIPYSGDTVDVSYSVPTECPTPAM